MKSSGREGGADLNETNLEEKTSYSTLSIQAVDRKLEQTVKLRLRKEDTILAMLGSTAIVVGLVEHDQFFSNDYETSTVCDGLRLIVMLISAISCLMVFRRYRLFLQLEKIRQKFSQGDTLVSSKLHRIMGVEMLVNLLHCPPGLNATFTVQSMNFTMTYSYNAFLTIFLLLRVYLVIRLFSAYSKFMQQRAEMVMRWYGMDASTVFAVKGYIYENPLISVVVILGAMSVFWSAIVLLIEQPDRHYDAHYAKTKEMDSTIQSSSLDSFTNCLWMVFVTTTTGKL